MRKTAKCTCCNGEFFTSEMVKTAMPNRGGNGAYMCTDCATNNRSYHTSNNELQGKAKQNSIGCGIEFETSFTDEYARNIMFEYGFIPTHDCSLHSDGNGHRYGYDGNACEYVSGIMQGLNIASKFAVTAEKLIADGHMAVNNSCGTHFHVSVNAMKDVNGQQTYIGYIQRFYHGLFVPLCNEMKANPEKTKAIFGRYFDSHYAKTIHADSYCGDRYNFINVVNSSNIEFRLNRFVNAKQFQNLIKMETEMTKAIVTNFCEHFMDTEWDTRRYEKRTAYRKHKADVTAQKLVKIFHKYSDNC